MPKTAVHLAIPLVAFWLAPVAADSTIQVDRQSQDTYRLTLTVDRAIGVGEAQQALRPTALELCGDLAPQFGKYRFSTRESLDKPVKDESFVLVQDITCGGGTEQVGQPTRPLSDEQRLAIEQEMRRRTKSYFNALAGENLGEAHAMLSDFMKSTATFDEWAEEQQQHQKTLGELGEIDVWQVTVYVDPPNAPAPGIYVATDFEANYKSSLVCGYVMWYGQSAESFRVMREETGRLPQSVVSKLGDAELDAMKRDFRCRPTPNRP